MQKFVAAPHAQVLGQLFAMFLHSLNREEILPTLQKYDLEHIDVDRWYPQQLMFDIFRDIHEHRTNVSENLVAVGMKAVEVVALPPEVNSIETALNLFPAIYTMNIKNASEGEGFGIQFLGKGHALATNNTPYPDDAFYGFLWGLVRRFAQGQNFFVRPLPTPDGNDASSTTYDIIWS